MAYKVGRHVALATVLIIAGSAQAQTDGKHRAYDYALRCFVAGGVAAGETGDPNGPAAAAIKAHAREAYDAAYKMGAALGYKKAQISADLHSYARAETRRLTTDAAYLATTRQDCAQLGLM